jgi:hypothetical protein
MAIRSMALALVALAVLDSCEGRAGVAEKAYCTGSVVDEQGNPVSEATVELHCVRVLPGGLKPTLLGATASDPGGSFRLEVTCPRFASRYGFLEVLAERSGYALGWERWEQEAGSACRVVLHQPVALGGKVLDQNGNPIADAHVSIAWLNYPGGNALHCIWGRLSPKRFSRRTDVQGRFCFEQMPQRGRPGVSVQKPGWATRFWSQGDIAGRAGRERDVQIVLQPEARVEGRVVEKATGRPVGGIRLTTSPEPTSMAGSTAVSRPDGTFLLGSLPAGHRTIFLETAGDGATQWAAAPLQVETVAGQTLGNVRFDLIRGGILEIAVTEQESGAPIAGCIARIPCKDCTYLMVSDSQGNASLRLVPGAYNVALYPMPGYIQECLQSDVEIQEGQTSRLSFQLPVQTEGLAVGEIDLRLKATR